MSGNAGEADLGDVAANLARGISTSRKGFRMGKWLLPLGRLVVDLRFFVRNGMEVSFREGVCKRLAKMLARGFMAGYGVWDNLVFLSSIGRQNVARPRRSKLHHTSFGFLAMC